ncbi:hypothetical protein N665_0448s0036 [Sinapis alba]|nr:hypothetical protein N665_0448s0036 [Sinapis alba]
MSLRWNKLKTGRLSRFMSELQQSPKSGGIMVVETGFPTSLIHLFVKNRDRLKKSSSKTKRIQRLIQTAPNASMPINTDAILETPLRSKIEKVNFVGGGLAAANNKHTSDKNVCVCGAFVLMAFKVFIVALLALSTKKKLTTGITLSAFALLITELATARVLTRFKFRNSDARSEKSVVSSVHDENVISCEKIETFDDSKEAISCLVETEPIAVTEDSNSKVLRIRDLLLKDEKSTSKSSKLKSKILKKLRTYKKKKSKTMNIKEETLSDVSSLVSEDNNSQVIESERDEVKSSPPLIESKGDKMNVIVVMVIVLTGLLSGKVVAIGLTLSCLYLRFRAAKKSGL